MLTSSLGKYLAPTSLGAAYAVAKALALRLVNEEWALQSDFTMQFLAGVLLGFSLRPLVKNVYWRWGPAVLVFGSLLLLLGPVGKFWDWFTFQSWPDPDSLKRLGVETIALLFVALVAPILIPPPQAVVTVRLLRKRLLRDRTWVDGLRFLGAGLAFALLTVAVREAFQDSGAALGFQERLELVLTTEPWNPWEKLGLLWLEGLGVTLLLWVLLSVYLRGLVELTVVLGSLVFVASDFAPAFANFNDVSPLLLTEQVFEGMLRSFGHVLVVLFLLKKAED